MRTDLAKKRVDAILDDQEERNHLNMHLAGEVENKKRIITPRVNRRRIVEHNFAVADAAVPVVALEEVIEWHAAWVPEPARPLWRKAFMDEFGGGDSSGEDQPRDTAQD